MAQTITYEAEDKKKGMSLEELAVAVSNAKGLAEGNGQVLSDLKVKVFVNLSAGIKQLSVEV